MQDVLAIIQLLSYFILMTLAGYLLNRVRFDPLGLVTAGALASYALILGDQFLGAAFPGEGAWVGRLLWAAYPLPAALWARAALLLKPGDNLTLDRVWWTLLLPVAVLLILGGWVGDDLSDFATREPGALYWTYALYNVVVTGLTAALLYQNYQQTAPGDAAHRALWWLWLAGVAFCGGMVILLTGIFSPDVVFLLTVLDVMVLGLGGIVYDAVAEGQTVRQDLMYAFVKSGLVAGLAVIPWAVVLTVSNTWTFALAVALLLTLTVVALVEEIERLLDKLLFQSGKLETREALRTLLLNAARQPDYRRDITQIDHDEFIRLTRRALSHMPNLPRLAASPLTQMQIIADRVDEASNSLQRANELRQVLAECIESLRPQERGEFGTTDEWRFFNALYYPYVAGISPYKRGRMRGEFDEGTTIVLRWFQMTVPPRTLYNWQNRGAALIADILLEREKQLLN